MSRLAGHIGAAIVGYIAASAAAGFSYAFLMVAMIEFTYPGSILWPHPLTEASKTTELLWFAIPASLQIAAGALIPSAGAIVVLAAARRTDILSYLVAGIVVGLLLVMIARHSNVFFIRMLEVDWITVLAGAIAGAVFWVTSRMLSPWPAKAP